MMPSTQHNATSTMMRAPTKEQTRATLPCSAADARAAVLGSALFGLAPPPSDDRPWPGAHAHQIPLPTAHHGQQRHHRRLRVPWQHNRREVDQTRQGHVRQQPDGPHRTIRAPGPKRPIRAPHGPARGRRPRLDIGRRTVRARRLQRRNGKEQVAANREAGSHPLHRVLVTACAVSHCFSSRSLPAQASLRLPRPTPRLTRSTRAA